MVKVTIAGLALAVLVIVGCGDTAETETDNPAKWLVVQSPQTGLCYEIYAPWNKQMAMVPIDCMYLSEEDIDE